MQKIEITLQKRKAKAVLYTLATVFITLINLMVIGALINSFVWYQLIILGLFAFGAVILYKALIEYYVYKEVKSVIESDGTTIKFYNVNENGKQFNESEEFKLADMARFYIVKTKKRYLMTDISFEFLPKSSMLGMLKEEVSTFPALWEGAEADNQKIMAFVSSVAPEIELGYESLYKRIAK